MRNIRRQQVQQKRKVRGLIYLTLGALFFVYLTLSLVFGENGLLRYLKLQKETHNLRSEIGAIRLQDEDVERHIRSLEDDPALIEELAREHGFAREGELIFKYEEDR